MKQPMLTDEQIVAMDQESETRSVAEVVRKRQVTEQMIYTWCHRMVRHGDSQTRKLATFIDPKPDADCLADVHQRTFGRAGQFQNH